MHLLLDQARVDHGAAVHDSHHAVYARLPVHERYLGHLRHRATERTGHGDTVRVPLGQRFAPASLCSHHLEHAFLFWAVLQQGQAVSHRILLGSARAFVDTAFQREGRMGAAHAAPPLHRNLGGGLVRLYVHHGHCVRQVVDAFGQRHFDARLRVHHGALEWRALYQRLGHHGVLPAERKAIGT